MKEAASEARKATAPEINCRWFRLASTAGISPIARDSLVSELRLHGEIRDRLQINPGYRCAIARSGQNHQLQAGLT